jgi:hypothetical protein
MANTAGVTKSFKREVLCGIHALGTTVNRGATTADVIKIALFHTSATVNTDTAIYTVGMSGELAATGTYVPGGATLTNTNQPDIDVVSGGAFWTPSDTVAWTDVTFGTSVNCAVLYNSSQTNGTAGNFRVISVHVFNEQLVTAGNFSLTMPANVVATALLRLL